VQFHKNSTPTLNKNFNDIPSDAHPKTVVRISDQVVVGFCKTASNGFQYQKNKLRRHCTGKSIHILMQPASLPLISCRKSSNLGGLCFSETGEISLAFQFIWPTEFVMFAKVENGIRFGDKSTTLEGMGLLLAIVQVRSFSKTEKVVVK
jgi:hypothetical protein